ncbi:MAG: hypothetical protein RL154_765 [Pseudomonadota bacterium]|jgi:hypothetical protein
MNAKEFHEFGRMLDGENIIFCYNGYVSQQIVQGMTNMLKQKIESADIKSGTSSKLLYVFIEQAQNIVRYSADRIDEGDRSKWLGHGSVALGMKNEKYYSMCGNLVDKNQANRLKLKLDQVASLDKDGLKILYKERLAAGPDDGSEGASLGFIEMARKSSEPIQYDFIDIDELYSFFYFKVII